MSISDHHPSASCGQAQCREWQREGAHDEQAAEERDGHGGLWVEPFGARLRQRSERVVKRGRARGGATH